MKFTTIGSAVGAAPLISPSARANAGCRGALLRSVAGPHDRLELGGDTSTSAHLVGFGGFGLAALRRGPKDRRAAGRREREARVRSVTQITVAAAALLYRSR